MLKNCLVRCPWCQSTGRKDFNGNMKLDDCSNKPIPDENLCPQCSGRIDEKTTYGGGWIHINAITLKKD